MRSIVISVPEIFHIVRLLTEYDQFETRISVTYYPISVT